MIDAMANLTCRGIEIGNRLGIAPVAPNPDSYFEDLLNGVALGKGTTREVFAVKDRTDVVIKKMLTPFPMSNMIEWLVWNALMKMGTDIVGNEPNTELKDCFAACFEISETGRYLMMERLDKLENSNAIIRSEFPIWLNDKKPNAFGRSKDGKIKVLDYAVVNFYSVLNPKNPR